MATQLAKAYDDYGALEASRQVQAYQNSQAQKPEPKLAGIYGDRPSNASNNELLNRILNSNPDERKKWSKRAARRLAHRRGTKNQDMVLWSRNSPAGTFEYKGTVQRNREHGYGFVPMQVGGRPEGGKYTTQHGAPITFDEGDHGVSAAYSPADNLKRTNTPKVLSDQIYARMTEARYKRMNEDRVPLYSLANRPLMIAA